MDTHFWRKSRPPLPRGQSMNMPVMWGQYNNQDSSQCDKYDPTQGYYSRHRNRPKSAEFQLDHIHPMNLQVPIKRNVLLRSPSEGDKPLLSTLERNMKILDMSSDSQENLLSDDEGNVIKKNPSFLQKMFRFSRRSRSRESTEGDKGKRSRSLTNERKNAKRSRSQTESRSRSPSNRSRTPSSTPSNTWSLESAGSFNNNSAAVLDNKLSSEGANNRKYLQLRCSQPDENKNVEGAPSPPIAVWSSDEDISSAPSTPQRQNLNNCDRQKRQRRTMFYRRVDKRESHAQREARIQKTISPELEEQISVTLREPAKPCKPKPWSSETQTAESEGFGSGNPALSTGASPRRFTQGQAMRRYGSNRHHSADLLEEVTSSSPKPEPKPRGPLRSYTRQRHHTIDLAQVMSNEADQEVSQDVLLQGQRSRSPAPSQWSSSTTGKHPHVITHKPYSPQPYVTHSPYVISHRPYNPTFAHSAHSPLGYIPQSSTSAASCLNYPSTPRRSHDHGVQSQAEPSNQLTSKRSHSTQSQGEQSDHVTYRRSHPTRGSWGHHSQLSPQDVDIATTITTVENVSTDSGIQQDSCQSSSESLKVKTIVLYQLCN